MKSRYSFWGRVGLLLSLCASIFQRKGLQMEMRMRKNFVLFFRAAFLIVFVFSIVPVQSVRAAAGDLTIEPNTWNVIGLDSVTSQMLSGIGPENFPVGV